MKNNFFAALALTLFCTFDSQLSTLHAQGTAFTYQGRLNDGANPATGSYDLRFSLYDAGTNGTAFGAMTNTATAVSNGLFTVPLDFRNVFDGNPRWLEIAVQKDGGGFTTLAPRQQITPTPYAIFANMASNVTGTIPASQITGSISATQLSGTIDSAEIAPGAVGNPQLGLCKISGFVTCNEADPTHTFVYVRGTSALAYVGDLTTNGYPYQLTLLEPGTYTVVSRTAGGYEVSSPVTVTAGQTVANINFSGINLLMDVNNCGACSNVCNQANGVSECDSGNCALAGCNPGYSNCDGDPTNGCETHTSNDPNNCGSCGHACSVANGTAACVTGSCAVASCNPGFNNCDGNPANGCEINTATDPNNCGTCGHVCPTGHACSNGACL